MDVKKINFRQPKYMLPAILYPVLIGAGYPFMRFFDLDTGDATDPRLKTTEYLSSDLPEAHTDSILEDKMNASQDMYGNISDLSGVNSVENDNDSIQKKEGYDSKYSESEAAAVERQQQQYKEELELRKMQNQVRENRSSGGSSDFVPSVSSSDIERVQRERRQRNWEKMNRDLSGDYSSSSSGSSRPGGSDPSSPSYGDGTPSFDSSEGGGASGFGGGPSYANGGGSSAGGYGGASGGSRQGGEDKPSEVTKKTRETSTYFNTVGVNNSRSKLIMAIIDENIKAVDGSRVRLRLLEDIEIDGETIPKGTYIYVTMSGFGQQRVQGRIESIFFDEEIMKVSLSLYDTDGLEGLYVPQSSFRENKQDILSSAMSGGGNIIDQSSTTTGIKGWASQAVTNASQRVMQALGKAAKKNSVKLKYGTRVYLMDTSKSDKRKGKNN